MRYRVLVDANGKPMRRREGYYVAASNGQSGIMSKRWVVENIDKFTNLRLCRKVLYLVQDVYENASEAIINNIMADMRSANGLNVIADATLYGFKQSMHEEAETREPKGSKMWAMQQLARYETSAIIVYKKCLREAIYMCYSDVNKDRSWISVTKGGSVVDTRFFLDQGKAQKYAEQICGCINTLDTPAFVLSAVQQLGLSL